MRSVREGLNKALTWDADEDVVRLVELAQEVLEGQESYVQRLYEARGRATELSEAAKSEIRDSQNAAEFVEKIYGRRFSRAETVREVLQVALDFFAEDLENWEFLLTGDEEDDLPAQRLTKQQVEAHRTLLDGLEVWLDKS